MATASTKRRARLPAPHIFYLQRVRELVAAGRYRQHGYSKGAPPAHAPFARAMLHVVLSRLPDSAVRMELIHPDVMRFALQAQSSSIVSQSGANNHGLWRKVGTTDERGRLLIRACAQNCEASRDRALALATSDMLLRLAENATRAWASSLPKAIKSIQALGLMTDDELRALIATCA